MPFKVLYVPSVSQLGFRADFVWGVSVYTTRAELPLFSRSTLRALASRKEDAVTEAKHSIDRLLQSQTVRVGSEADVGNAHRDFR